MQALTIIIIIISPNEKLVFKKKERNKETNIYYKKRNNGKNFKEIDSFVKATQPNSKVQKVQSPSDN